jgi:TetR/AcrR family transcriptional repressor of nem operon
MTTRAEKKQESLERILTVASRKLREEGVDGTAIAPVMAEAGLTHGTFYSHFDSKDALAADAFRHALRENQPGWLKTRPEPFKQRLKRLAKSYLSRRHRDSPETGCAIGALVSEVPKATDTFRDAYTEEVASTLSRIAEVEPGNLNDHRIDDAIRFLAMSVGGISLARAVNDDELSNRILSACRDSFEV